MKPLSLKFRLSVLVSMLLVATIATISIVAYIELEEFLLRSVDPTLKAMAAGIISNIDEPQSYEVHQAEFRSITDYTGGRRPTIYRIWMDGSKDELFASNSLADTYGQLLVNLPVDNQPEVGESSIFNLNQGKHSYRAIWARHSFERGVVNIVVVHSSHYVYHEMGEFLQLLLILGGSMVLGAFLLTPQVIAWGMSPIKWTIRQMQRITPKDLGREDLHNENVPEELSPFVEALCEMLLRLDKAMRQQRQFTADASHELRTPLALIKSTIQTTRMRDRDVAEYKQALDETLKDIERIIKLTTQLLSLAQMDETGDLPNRSKLSLDGLLRNLCESFDSRASRQAGRVLCEEFLSVQVWGNAGKLTQLFNNLIDNAVQYGSADAVVRISLEDKPDGYVTVCIHNEGGYIAPEVLPHVFDRFYRADSSRSLATGGTGLGLAIAREIARQHEGDIEMTSNPTTGTSVFVRLPRL